MLAAQKNLSNRFLVLLSLPTAAIGFCLSSAVASTTWLLSTKYNLHLENIALIWLMGPLMGLLVQPIVGALSDRTWFLRGRRRPYLLLGGISGAAATYAMLHLDTLAAATGLSLLAVAVVVVLICDLATNVTFNPARSLVADLTPEGPHRVRGYTWMQMVSGVLGISAYLISIFLGNEMLVLATVVVTFTLTVIPVFFIEERAPEPALAETPGAGATARAGASAFRALLPMSGFALYGMFIAIDKLALDGALAGWAVPLFLATLAITLAWGGGIVWRSRARPTPQRRLSILLLGHGFAWLGVQSMFVMAFFYVRDFVVPDAGGWVMADTAGRVLSIGFLLLNVVGAALPVLLLKPLCLRWGKVAVHRSAMGLMAAAYGVIALGSQNEAFYYLGMLLVGIGWSSLISVVFAIYSESVDAKEMGMAMGVFNSSLVLPALAVPGLLKLSDALGEHRWMFLLFAASLAVSFAFWSAVSERVPEAAA
jgi:Na+/melibiose symporter-like transporter